MAGIETVPLAERTTNDILKSLEGTPRWDTTSLTYIIPSGGGAALTATQAEFATRGRAGTVNLLDAADASENQQRNAIVEALEAFERVSGLNFTVTTNFAAADFKFSGVDNFSLAGQSTFPGTNLKAGETTDFESWNFLNTTDFWTTHGREVGGADFMLYNTIHEIQHGLGVGHPHDTGHGTTMIADPGQVATDTPLDNERYTVMSYERGGRDSNLGFNFGHAATPMALDIAVLQNLYGANGSTNTGATTYNLVDRMTAAYDADGSDGVVTVGRAWFSIWDAGGTDTIDYDGGQRVMINLNPATLTTTASPDLTALLKDIQEADKYAELPVDFRLEIEGDGGSHGAADYHAGGFFSRVFENTSNFDMGGYSIANGVVIENAEGGAKADFLIGNEANNRLVGLGGDDYIHGYKGNDTIIAGAGDDQIVGGQGNDTINGGAGDDTAIFSESCHQYEIDKNVATGVVTITHKNGGADGVDVLINVETAQFADATVDLTVDNPTCVTDFIFLVDLSGSFWDDLPNFQASARSIANTVRAEDPEARFALASFVDRPVSPWGGPGDYLYKPELALTDSITAFETAVGGLTTFNGGDFPEAQMVGLWRAANGIGLNLREDSRKVILLATDASAHSAATYGLDESTIQAFLEEEGVDVTPISPLPDPAAPTTGTATVSGGDAVSGDIPPDEGSGTEGHGDVPELSSRDLLTLEVARLLREVGGTPIFAVTAGSDPFYSGIQEELGRGVTVGISGSSDDITDAVRVGLAEISGSDALFGDGTDNVFIGSDDVEDHYFGLGGNDRIEGRGLGDILDGGSGDDTILGEGGDDVIFGGTGRDTIDAGSGNDIVEPGLDPDLITLGPGADILRGSPNDLDGDRVTDFSEHDRILIPDLLPGSLELAEDGDDTKMSLTFAAAAAAPITITLEGTFLPGTLHAYYHNGLVVAFAGPIDGTTGDDHIIGGDGDDTILGRAGDDNLDGWTGDDVILGGAGNDTLSGRTGNDELFGGPGDDVVRGGGGDDWLRGAGGDDHLVGGPGRDMLFGGSGHDKLFGGSGHDVLRGAGGNDLLNGGGGHDRLIGGAGNDNLLGALGDDSLFGGGGNDVLRGGIGDDFLNGGGGHDRLLGGAGDDRLVGAAGDDRLFGGQGNDELFGGHGNDVLRSGGGHDLLNGGGGNDNLFGGPGNDTLIGGPGDDVLRGGGGDNVLIGGPGNDTLFGGPDEDQFVYTRPEEGVDRIIEFTPAEDLLIIHASEFGGGLSAGDLGATRLVTGEGPEATRAFGQFLYDTGSGELYWDRDGTGGQNPFHLAELSGVPLLTASDFNLV